MLKKSSQSGGVSHLFNGTMDELDEVSKVQMLII